MSQKFINPLEKTEKKTPHFGSNQGKRFVRKRSSETDRSIDSKRSRNSALEPHIIKQIPLSQNNKNSKVYDSQMSYFQQLAQSVMLSKDLGSTGRQKYGRTRTDRWKNDSKQLKNDIQIQLQTVNAQLQVRNKELEVMASECQMLKQNLQTEKEKRKRAQNQKKILSQQTNEKVKQIQKLLVDNKKLSKQKQYLVKQIEFLQKINFDDKTRNAQSYRQKYLQKQNQELKKQLQKDKGQVEKSLQLQIKRVNDQKYTVEKHYNSLKLANQTLIKQFQKYRSNQKKSLFQTEQYVRLRDKYKLCLDAYKKLKIQYCELQKQLNKSLNHIAKHSLDSDSELSVVLSSSSSQQSPIKKKKSLKIQNILEKQNLSEQEGGHYAAELTVSNTPPKKSLSPRNCKQEQNTPTFVRTKQSYKTPSPNSSKKVLSPRSKPNSSPDQNRTQNADKKIEKVKNSIFNDAYRLKLGLNKLGDKKQVKY